MNREIPLAERMRPNSIEDFVGQKHLLGEGKPLFNAIKFKKLHSMILWGPPGVGKTTLARILANSVDMPYYSLSAIQAGVKEVRAIFEEIGKVGQAVLFLDEIHRFNKSQQDSLLGAVEKGQVILIGATTENPSFEVNQALLSRCQVYVLNPLEKEDLILLCENALEKDALLHSLNIEILEYDALIDLCSSDARKLNNLLELIASKVQQDKSNQPITNKIVTEIAQRSMAKYDKNGEQHYDIISAFIKSIRGSDPNAALYWMARMIEGGEDPKFIARRILILASEDIGNANPNALLMANTCFQAVNVIGYPECRIILSQTVIYLATSVKSNASYTAINDALVLARQTMNLLVPLKLRNAPTKLMKDMSYGKDYRYSHNYEGNFVQDNFYPEALKGKMLYNPGQNSREEEIRKNLKKWWEGYYKY